MAVGWPPLQVLQFNLLSQVLTLCFGFIGCKHLKQYFFFDKKLFLSFKAMSMNFRQPSNWWFIHSLYMVIPQMNHQIFPLILIHMLQPFLILFSCQCAVPQPLWRILGHWLSAFHHSQSQWNRLVQVPFLASSWLAGRSLTTCLLFHLEL